MSRPLRSDIEAREALELLERAARTSDAGLALEAARQIAKLRPRYSLVELAPSEAESPVLCRARYPGHCSGCLEPIVVDAPIAFEKATRRITCTRCTGGHR